MNWHDYFIYDIERGGLIWKPRDPATLGARIFNTNCAGKRVGCNVLNPEGRRWFVVVGVAGLQTKVHRVVWEMHNGAIPSGLYIDHINGDPWDNRIENLRLATNAQNQYNAKRPKSNTTGYKGVCYNKAAGKFQAGIRINRRVTHLGMFDTAESAHAAYREAAEKHFGEFARMQ